jgi:PAS domain S-box-containing protein
MIMKDTASVGSGRAAAAPPRVQAIMASRTPGSRYLWRNIAWPLALACGFLILISAASAFLVIRSQSNSGLVNHTLRVANKLSAILADVRIAESEQRGYLLTDDPAYLEVYRGSINTILPTIADLTEMTIDNPVQQRSLAAVERLVTRKLGELRETIRLHDTGDHAAALALLRTGVGHDLMTEIRSTVHGMIEEEERLLAIRTADSGSTNLWLLVVDFVGLALVVALAVISILMVRRMTEKELTQSENRGNELQAAADEHRAADQKFEGLLEAAPDAIIIVNRNGEIVLLNLQSERQFGYRRDELLGQKVKNIIPEGFAERLLADGLRSAEDALAQQIGTGIELTGKRKDGSEFPIEIMLSPLDSAEGILVTAAIRDISVRKNAEKHLAQMEGRYRGLLEAAPDAMVVVNQGGDIVLLNVQAEKQFGYHRDELVGQKVKNIIPEGFAERLIADGTRTAADALAQQIGMGIELSGRRKDGSEFPIEIMLSPLESDEEILVTAAIRDISVRKAADRHLAQMEGRYRGLLEAAPDAMVVVNQAGEIVLLNVQAEKQFGYRRDELVGQKVKNVIPEGFAERLIADGTRSAADALAQQIGMGIELSGRRRDGSEFPIEIMLSPLESAEGTLVTAAIRDISVRKAAEGHLAQMESRYRGLLEAAPDAMVVVNQGGDIVLLNVQAEKQFGYRRDELLGQEVKNIIPEGFAERLIADGTRSAADALAQQIGTGIELSGRRWDGSEFPIEIMLSPLESAEGILVTAAIRDISVRKAAEKHLAQMEGRYRGLLEAAPDAMVVVNQGGDIILLNVQAEKQFGYRRDELLGQKVKNIIPEGFAERLLADGLRSAEDALAQQIGTGIELSGRRKDGGEFPIEIMLSPLESAEGILVTAAIRDITERKRHEGTLQEKNIQLEAAVDELEAFSYSVSHDLRTPLRAIDGFSRILLKQYGPILPEEPREYLQLVRDNTVQMGHLVDDLLAFSRLGRQALKKRQVATGTIVAQVLRDARGRAEGRSVSVSVGETPSVWGDPSLLKQVFVNLIDNAFKYTRLRAEAVIEIGSRESGGECVFFVRDNGAGFDMRYADKLFGVFQRLHRAEDFEGTGVGLAIVQRIVQRHGGRIWAEAAIDRGATFFFTTEGPNHA